MNFLEHLYDFFPDKGNTKISVTMISLHFGAVRKNCHLHKQESYTVEINVLAVRVSKQNKKNNKKMCSSFCIIKCQSCKNRKTDDFLMYTYARMHALQPNFIVCVYFKKGTEKKPSTFYPIERYMI